MPVTCYALNCLELGRRASGSATGVLGETLSGLDFSGTTHTNAVAAHSDTITFTDVTGNYNDTSRARTSSMAKKGATIAGPGYIITYTNTAHSTPCTATAGHC